MILKRIESAEVKTVYIDLLDGNGYYCNSPGMAPFICLDNTLLRGSEAFHQEVYQLLLDYHRSIPLDSIFRSFVIVKYYEDLTPANVEVAELFKIAVEIEWIGCAVRHRVWDIVHYEFGPYAREPHVIGI